MTTIDNSLEWMLNNNGDEPLSNHSDNTHFADIIAGRYSRRTVLQGTAGASLVGFLALAGCGGSSNNNGGGSNPGGEEPVITAPRLGFDAIPSSRADTISLPAGYEWAPLVPWGTPLLGGYPAYRDDGLNTGVEALQQVGSHHDGMHFFPINGSSSHGLLVLNHEYVDQKVLHGNGPSPAPRPQDEVLKEMAAHGVSVVEVRRSILGGSEWEVVKGSGYNHRVTALTRCEMTGPVRGHDKLKTVHSPNGTRTRGTLNNCSHGYTPWDTYLTCEENWAGYFANTTAANAAAQPREQSRYGVPRAGSRYLWETCDPAMNNGASSRFDIGEHGASATADYRNEANGQGWILEIDPFDPQAMPKKRTSLGRFGHEGIVFAKPMVGKPVVFYSGDDANNEYIYKYVSHRNYAPGLNGDDLLTDGVLYVAKFNEDGSGEWLPLDFNNADFMDKANTAGHSFTDQGDILLNTRLAADIMGATKMDRPEWGAVCPRTGAVYFTLTNNSGRSTTDEANPRANNRTGHIIRWTENGDGHAIGFAWDIFLLAGHTSGPLKGSVLPGTDLEQDITDDNYLASPDGVWFDSNGVLWIQTDMSGGQQAGTSQDGDFGNNQMLAAETDTGVLKRFLVGPMDAEVTGVVMTPDNKTMFVNLQHPGDRSDVGNFTSHFPANDGVSRPRSTTVVITRTDGGVIGL